MNAKTIVSAASMLVVAIVSLWYMTTLGLQVKAFEDLKTARMTAPDTNGLVVGSRVLLRGVPIGNVTAISSASENVTIDWDYDSNYAIPESSELRLENLSALGEPFISVLPQSEAGPYLPDGAKIAPERVTVPTTVKELSARLTHLLEQIEPDQIQQIFTQLDIALPDGSATLQELSRAGSLLASMMINSNGEFSTDLDNVQTLLLDSEWLPGGLDRSSQDIARFGAGLQGFLDAAHATSIVAPLPEGIALGTGPFLAGLQNFLDKAAPDIKILAEGALPGVQSSAAALQTLDVSQILTSALDSTSSGDSVTVHLDVAGR